MDLKTLFQEREEMDHLGQMLDLHGKNMKKLREYQVALDKKLKSRWSSQSSIRDLTRLVGKYEEKVNESREYIKRAMNDYSSFIRNHHPDQSE